MNNSSVCGYRRGKEWIPKVKYLTVEEAREAARLMNAFPTVIHLFKEYKCTTCHYFHVGKSKKLKEATPQSVFNPATHVENIPQNIPQNIPLENIWPVIPKPVQPNPIQEGPTQDDFDWNTNKKIIKRILK